MRVKLTAKHPRSASSERAPVRSGSATARKPVRPAGPRPATPRPAERDAKPKPAGAVRRSSGGDDAGRRPAGDARPARAEGSFSRSRDAGKPGTGRASSERAPRRESSEGAPRRAGSERGERAPGRFATERTERAPRRADGERGERTPGRFASERTERAPRRGDSERGERTPGRFASERTERAPRRADGERGERAPRRFEGERSERPPRARNAENDRNERPPRFSRDESSRRPTPAGARGAEAGSRDDRPAARREFSGSRERGDRTDRGERSPSERPRFSSERSGSQERRSFDRPSRDDAPRRGPSTSRDERTSSKERGSFERGERSFAKPVRSSYGDRPGRAERPAGGREFGDRPARTDRPASTRQSHSGERGSEGRFAVRDRADKPPRGASPVGRSGRPDEARESAPRREHDDAPGTLRLSKLMSELGLCSRREADEWIENGWVRVDGEKIDTLGTKVRPDQRIEIDPAAQAMQARQVTILLHKPVGYVSGQAEDGYQPAITLVTPDNRWEGDRSDIRFSVSHLRQLAPAGRLDIDSTGLLVLTQDGRIAKRLIGGHSEVEKEYLVRVTYGEMTTEIDQHFPPESLALLRHGLELDDQPLKPAKVSWQNGEQLRFVLREGKKRQIRRMCELVGLEVVGLKRVRMGSVPLGALPPGQWRYLAQDESF